MPNRKDVQQLFTPNQKKPVIQFDISDKQLTNIQQRIYIDEEIDDTFATKVIKQYINNIQRYVKYDFMHVTQLCNIQNGKYTYQVTMSNIDGTQTDKNDRHQMFLHVMNGLITYLDTEKR